MQTKRWSALAFGAVFALSACSIADEPTEGSATAGQITTLMPRPTADAGVSTSQMSQDDLSQVAFGEIFTYEDGVAVSISQPETFMPSATSINGGEPEFVSFQVSVANASPARVLPTDIFVTVGSGSGEGGEVLDPDGELPGPPLDAIAPGGEASWSLAFGVFESADVIVRVQLGIDADPITFGG